MTTKIGIIKELYSALNRNDVTAAIQLFDPEIIRVEPEGFPAAGTYRGLTEMKFHLTQGLETWAEGGCYPKDFVILNDRILVDVHVHVRLKGKQDWIDDHVADVFKFKNNKIVEMRSFINKEEFLKKSEKSGTEHF